MGWRGEPRIKGVRNYFYFESSASEWLDIMREYSSKWFDNNISHAQGNVVVHIASIDSIELDKIVWIIHTVVNKVLNRASILVFE